MYKRALQGKENVLGLEHTSTLSTVNDLGLLYTDIDAKTNGRNTAPHMAAEDGHEAVVRLLLEHKADADVKDDDGRTALHRAAENGHETVVQLQLEHKADVDAKDNIGKTALHWTASRQLNGMAAVLSALFVVFFVGLCLRSSGNQGRNRRYSQSEDIDAVNLNLEGRDLVMTIVKENADANN